MRFLLWGRGFDSYSQLSQHFLVHLRLIPSLGVYHTFKYRCLPWVINIPKQYNLTKFLQAGTEESVIEGDKVNPVGKVFSLSRAGYGWLD